MTAHEGQQTWHSLERTSSTPGAPGNAGTFPVLEPAPPADERQIAGLERAIKSCPAQGTLLHPPRVEIALRRARGYFGSGQRPQVIVYLAQQPVSVRVPDPLGVGSQRGDHIGDVTSSELPQVAAARRYDQRVPQAAPAQEVGGPVESGLLDETVDRAGAGRFRPAGAAGDDPAEVCGGSLPGGRRNAAIRIRSRDRSVPGSW